MDKTIYEKAIEKWGVESQLNMAKEECAELIVALCKVSRTNNGCTAHEVASEIADVEIMIEQLEYIFDDSMPGGTFREYVEHTKKEKRAKLEKLVNEDD